MVLFGEDIDNPGSVLGIIAGRRRGDDFDAFDHAGRNLRQHGLPVVAGNAGWFSVDKYHHPLATPQLNAAIGINRDGGNGLQRIDHRPALGGQVLLQIINTFVKLKLNGVLLALYRHLCQLVLTFVDQQITRFQFRLSRREQVFSPTGRFNTNGLNLQSVGFAQRQLGNLKITPAIGKSPCYQGRVF